MIRRVVTAALGLLLMLPAAAHAEPVRVQLQKNDAGWQLLRDGQPYFIRGAGGDMSLAQLAAAGANSIRTWGADDIEPLLDEAHALGLTVAVGIWLGHERHGFDYHDPEQVRQQLASARAAVLRYKDHPALLLWGVGNEMEGFGAGDDPAIWRAVNDVAAMIKSLDPHHPTMTVTAEIGGGRVKRLHHESPAIDIHGINSYGGAPSLLERYRAAGATKPFILTEFGPPGTWEAAKTEWGAVIELTSAQKADAYRHSYARAVTDAPGLALGSYTFHWGYKMEGTATWFGMFLPGGARLGAVDAMTELWSGHAPDDLSPVVEPLVITGPAQVDPGDTVQIQAAMADPENGPLAVRWVLRTDSTDYVTGGDFRPMLPDIEDAIVAGGNDGARVRMPREPGPYRVFVYVTDKAGNAATANVPVLVKGKVRTRLPVYVYADDFAGMPWAPSGWMGSHELLTLDGAHADNPRAGESCIKMRYTGKGAWVAVAWQHPANNWGEQDGGYDLTGARHLEFWARGEYGGETIKAGVGLLGNDRAHPDSGQKAVDNIVLTQDWKRYRIPLRRVDLSSIKTGFVVTLYGRATPVTIYLDNIAYTR